MRTQEQPGIEAYKASGFMGKEQELVRKVVLPYQQDVLQDKAGTEKSHVYDNYRNAAAALRGEGTRDGFYGMVFQDSDAAKWLEAAAYSLGVCPDRGLEAACDELIALISAAQDKDGYLNTRFTISDRDKRWTNLLEGHEMYCSGHMFEAGAAYYEATGKRTLLDVCLKNAEHIYNRFVKDATEGYPGHPEIELALMKLYRASGEKRCLELAEHFINVRGVDPDYYRKECESRDWTVWGGKGDNPDYQQSGKPVREQTEASGHSVRAAYLYTAMADLAAETGDEFLLKACRRLWDSITQRRMYVTGGIGSTVHGEAFWADYDLPSDTAYAETCASIGLMFFAYRMLQNECDSRYADVMEQAFYNTVLSGMALDGKSFFYVNPLETVLGISGIAPTHKHTLPTRPGWYACACCPPNVARTVMSIGKYAYGESTDIAFCHLYAAGEVSFRNGISFICETDYPYGLTVIYRIRKGGRLAVRLPQWSRKTRISLNGVSAEYETDRGYAYLYVRDGDELILSLDGEPRYVYASRRIAGLTGKMCVCRGPLVYCMEGADNGGTVLGLRLTGGKITETSVEGLPGVIALKADACRIGDLETLYSQDKPAEQAATATLVPYYCRANRGETDMKVWS